MIRTPVVLAAAIAVALAATPVPAAAAPSDSACAYTLSPPHVVALSGATAVAATLAPAGCQRANAYLSVACVQLQGSDGPGQCAQNNGTLTAQVFYQPYRPGATYIATGRGCANTGNPPQSVCTSAGPLTATL
jgi:hypothetical protein